MTLQLLLPPFAFYSSWIIFISLEMLPKFKFYSWYCVPFQTNSLECARELRKRKGLDSANAITQRGDHTNNKDLLKVKHNTANCIQKTQ